MALIIVMTCLALLAIMVVSFLASAGSEVRSGSVQMATIQVRNLSSGALNLVMGQVASGVNTLDRETSWMSQPGLLRTFKAGSTQQAAIYKLYSDADMVLTGAAAANFQATAATPPNDWNTRTAIFTDLNAPRISEGRLSFPVVDPRASETVGGPRPVKGFRYDTDIAGANAASADTARLPMPVRWLYVLKDGQFVAPQGDGSTATIPGASRSNPVVGRVAFWTDDESCRINVNTAAEGHFWDTPMASFSGEMPSNENFPAKNEFQRYAGHPSTTSLSVVFPWLDGTSAGLNAGERNTAIYELVPRIEQGGSLEGTRFAGANDAVVLDADRLLENVDELIFRADRSELPSLENPLLAQTTPQDLEWRRFFLTTTSRSPEVTLFNTPRVAIWPLDASPARRHAAERLIGFAASVGRGQETREYFFTRSAQHDPDADFQDASRNGRNREVLSYLQAMTEWQIPGFGPRTFAEKWTGLNAVTGVTTSDRDQILIQIYDYIRSCLNLRTKVANGVINSSTGVAYTGDDPGQRGNVFPTALTAGSPLANGRTIGTDAKGFGRFPTVKEVSMLFAAEQDAMVSTGTDAAPARIWPALLTELFLPASGPKPYASNLKVTVSGLSSFQWEVTETKGGTPVAKPMFGSDEKTFTVVDNIITHSRGLAGAGTGYMSVNHLYYTPSKDDTETNNPAGPAVDNWSPDFRFLGGTVHIVIDGGSTSFGSDTARQRYSITFPPMTARLPNPKLWKTTSTSFPTFTSRITNNHALSLLVNGMPTDIVKSMVLRHGDYRLVATDTGVIKGGPASDSSNLFVPHRNYDSGLPADADPETDPQLFTRTSPLAPFSYNAHTLRGNPPLLNHELTDKASYVASPALPYAYEKGTDPDLAGGIGGAFLANGRPGDWDNGLGNTPDGPFINKPDEGLDEAFSVSRATNYLMYANMFYTTDALEQFFGPMRQLASPVFFGSLPAAAKRGRPWETLLFCPNPAAGWGGTAPHPGQESPPDHLLLDWFWMPVTEPYAISDSFSTAGKINLNYQIVPFSYITRDTGLRAVLASPRVAALTESTAYKGKMGYKNIIQGFYQEAPAAETRFSIDADETLKQFEERFAAGGVFRSATEICDILLVPKGQSLTNVRDPAGFWSSHRITGDNLRERPYNAIYPRVTTRSNVYTVYIKAQALKQKPGNLAARPEEFKEGDDFVEAEYQTAITFERYLDPQAPPPEEDTDPLGPYKLRVLNQRDFVR
jgi:uncharacterized protein (TIGR02600 family)